MAVADITKTFPRVSWLIGARSSTFNSTVENDNFIQEEITRALIETESEIAEDMANAKHPLGVDFIAWSSDLTSGSLIPKHFGDVEGIQIKLYSGASGYELAESTTRENIRLWRVNYGNAFDAINHDQSGSGLSPFFNLTGRTLTFTGYRAQAQIFTFTPNYTAHQIDANFEPNIICGAIPKLLKIGVPTALASHYGNQYLAMQQKVRSGQNDMPEINVLQKID